MPVYVYVVLNVVLSLGVVGAIFGLQLWSILTQHRDLGGGENRLHRRGRHTAIKLIERRAEARAAASEGVVG